MGLPLGLVMLGWSALAQQSVIEHCKNTSSDADRIACLEAALISKEEPPEPQVAPVAAPEPAAQVDPPSMEIEAEPVDDTIEPEAQSQIDPPSMDIDASPASTKAAAETQPVGIGAEQVIANNQTKEEIKESRQKAEGMVIAKYEWVPYERLVVYFENGQVWRQIKGDKNRIRTSLERNQTADVSEAGLSGYQLRLNEIRRTIRVERIR